jgi:hypothetical protein
MRFAKGLCLGLVGFLLFVVLPLFGLTLTMKYTLLDPQFIIAESQKMDISTAAKEFLADQSLLDQTYLAAADRSFSDLEQWTRQQVSQIIRSCYNYWLGKTAKFAITLNLVPLKQSLIDNLNRIYANSPPDEYLALAPDRRAAYLDQIRQDTLQLLPDALVIDESLLGDSFPDINSRIRGGMGFIRSGFVWLAVAAAVLVLLLIVVQRKLRAVLLSGGTIFLLAGALMIIALVLARSFLPQLYPQDLVPEIQVWLPVLISDILRPCWIFAWALLAGGALLLAVSLFVRSRTS